MKRRLFLVTLCLLVVFLFTACGGTIDTELTIDDNFAGKRVINVTVANDDLAEYVTGGIDALKLVADQNLPAQLTCTHSTTDSGEVLTFTMEFTGLDDYKTKVAALISAGSNTELVPEILYENEGTYFKQGIVLEENFNSFDLLQWYFDALQTAQIITESSTSNWYEMGSNIVYVGSNTYEPYGNTISINEKDYNCLSSIDVETTLHTNGSFTRVFTFEAYSDTVTALSEKGCELSSYLQALTASGDTFEETVDDSRYIYTITVNASDAATLVQKTNAILQTENTFNVTLTLDPAYVGTAKVKVEESLDGSFYLNYQYSSDLDSVIHVYDNSTLVPAETDFYYSYYDDEMSYRPELEKVYTFDFDWKIGFAAARMELDISSEDTAEVTLEITSNEALPEDVRVFAVDALKQYCGENGSFSENELVSTITFSGTTEEINTAANAFIGKAIALAQLTSDEEDLDSADEAEYFTLTYQKSETKSAFSNGYSGELDFDLSPVIGSTLVQFEDQESFLADSCYSGYFQENEEGIRAVSSASEVSFSIIKLSLVKLILTALFALCLLAGVIVTLCNIGNIKAILADMKRKSQEKKMAKQAAAAYAAGGAPQMGYPQYQQPVYEQPVAQPVYEQPAPAPVYEQPVAPAPQPAAPAANEEESEDLL